MEKRATAAAEEILRIIYGDDLEGCAVNLDSVVAVIRAALEGEAGATRDLEELQEKGLEAIHLLSTPPPDGQALSAEDLRTLLGERLDNIRTIADKILAVTKSAKSSTNDRANGASDTL